MVDLVRVVKRDEPMGRRHYDVLHGAPFSLIPEMSKPYVFEAIIMSKNEELPFQWTTELANQKPTRFYFPEGIELAVLRSDMEINRGFMPSRSQDSDAQYLAHSIGLGTLIQYIDSNAWRTMDRVAHTSAHDHKDNETFYSLHGSAQVWFREGHSGEVHKLPIGTGNGENKILSIGPRTKHPIVAFGFSLVLIHATPQIVSDQVNGTSLYHKNGVPFRELYSDVLANLVRKA